MSKWGLNDLMLAHFQSKAGTTGAEAGQLVRATVGTVTIATSDTTMAGTESITVNGRVWAAQFTAPNMEGSDSTKMELINALGGTTYTSGTKAESTVHWANVGGTSAIYGTTKVVMTAEGTQSANRSVPYLILTER